MSNQESQNNSLIAETDPKQYVCENYKAATEFFDQLPSQITNLKKTYILDQATVNKRFVFLCLTTLAAAGITSRFNPSFIKITRNAFISYLGAGLFILPEVFNPYLIYRK
ncbi:unnamed protein product [Paramecium sonneborni]|uniref:Uncharacterized protein n=1 Tax=Paramecium sonneborni TaxID=65129 RepID=A0A8S1PF79_9CILI|nr:unnamed protein product [Paramecium sonneborni]